MAPNATDSDSDMARSEARAPGERRRSQRLRHLERDGLVARTFHAGVPPRVEYEISPLGLSLTRVFGQLVEWGDTNLSKVKQARISYDQSESLE